MSNETQPQGQSKPDSPGLWEREESLWRVWDDGCRVLFANEIYQNGRSGDTTFVSILPTGNWRKVSHILTDAEHAEWEAYKAEQARAIEPAEGCCVKCGKLNVFSARQCGTGFCHPCANKELAKLQAAHSRKADGELLCREEDSPVWMIKGKGGRGCLSAARDLACRAMEALSMDSANDWRARDQIIEGISPRLEAMLNDAAAQPHRDEVAGLKGIIARQDEEIKVLKELVSPTSLDIDQSADEEKPISPTMLRRFRKAAHDIGGLFTWSVQNLQKFPPPPGKEWLDEIKERLLAGAQSPAPPVPEVIEGRGQELENMAWYAWENRPGSEVTVFRVDVNVSNNIAHAGCRYIKIELPTFPPTPAPFVAPPKPELAYRLYEVTRGDDKGKFYWGFTLSSNGADLATGNGKLEFHNFSWCREVDQATGKPVGETTSKE